VPIALSCSLRPSARDGTADVMAIETRVAALTLSAAAGDLTPLSAAVIDAVPAPVAFANPLGPIVAMAGAEELQMAELLRSCVERSLYVPVAVNCCWVPLARVAIAGVTAIEANAAPVTFKVTPGDATPPSVAVMRVVPTVNADA
jgi:hypothetical protein